MSSRKKVKQESKGEGAGKQAQPQPFDNLPPKILQTIFNCLPTSTLFRFRLVNRKWNEISSSLLRHRPSTLLNFFRSSNGDFLLSELPSEFNGGIEKMMFGMINENNEFREASEQYKTLEELLDCFEYSKKFPFAHFSFKGFYGVGGGDELKTFLTLVGSKILSIKISPPSNEKDIKWPLLKLLTKYCLELEELIFDEDDDEQKYLENLKLFNSDKGKEIPLLPNLQSLYLSKNFKKYSGVVQDILNAATNLQEIRGYWEESDSSIKLEDIILLNELGKLDLIQSAFLKSEELVDHWKKFPGQIMRLSKLLVEAKDVNLNELIEYSKDTLKELVILRTGIATPDVNWSLIPNLEKLSLPATQNPRSFFPAGQDNNILPNLKELEVESTGLPKKLTTPLVPFPSVKVLKLKFDWYLSPFVNDLSIMFPNVTCLDLSSMRNFELFGHAIWKNMKQLMTLSIFIPKQESNYEDEDFDFEGAGDKEFQFTTQLDVCFTGFSKEVCLDLKKKFEGKTKVSESVLSKYQREKPSIVDMEYLSTLRLKYGVFQCFSWPLINVKQQLKQKVQEAKKQISCVSRLFAFQQMPNLEILIDTEVTDTC